MSQIHVFRETYTCVTKLQQRSEASYKNLITFEFYMCLYVNDNHPNHPMKEVL